MLALGWALAKRDHHSIILGLHSRKIALRGVETRWTNLESADSAARALAQLQPEVVIHAASMTSVEACESRPELAQHANVELAKNVAQACSSAGIRLVHISTDHLFSGEKAGVSESEPVAPKNVYARTKAEAELRVLEACPQALVVRTNFYGWGPSYRHSFSDVIVTSLREHKPIMLFRDVFYTPILSEFLVNAVHDLVEQRASGILHVVGDERISKYDFGLKLARQFELDASLIKAGCLGDQGALVPRPRDMSLCNEQACRLLGRKLGGTDEQLQRLQQQEKLGTIREVQNL